MRCHTYTLIGQTPVPEPNLDRWSRWMEFEDRVVKQTHVEGTACFVSTVFLGIDYQFTQTGPPILFETMVFADGHAGELEMSRCSTWLEAEAQHDMMIEYVEERYGRRGIDRSIHPKKKRNPTQS